MSLHRPRGAILFHFLLLFVGFGAPMLRAVLRRGLHSFDTTFGFTRLTQIDDLGHQCILTNAVFTRHNWI